MTTVVREEKDKGVLRKPQLLKFPEDRPHTVVGALDHGRVGGVLMAFGRLLGLILLLEFRLGLDGGMNGVMGQVEKKRFLLIGLDKLTGFLAQAIGQVLALFLLLEVGVLVGAVVSSSAGTAPGLARHVDVEALRRGVVPEVPLAHGGGYVSTRLKSLAHGDELFRQMNRVLGRNQLSVLGGTSIGIRHGINTMPRRILSGHQTGPTGGAIGGRGIGVHKDHSLLGELVDMRTLVVFRAHETEIGPPHVVDEKENYVGLGRQGGAKRAKKEQEAMNSHQRTTKKGTPHWSNPFPCKKELSRVTSGSTRA